MRKNFLGFCLFLSCLIVGAIGCSKSASPTSTNNNTTATTTPGVYTFTASSTSGWFLGYGGGTAPANSVAVTNWSYSLGTGGYGLGLIFTGTAGDNDLQAEVNGSTQGFPMNFTTLNATGVSALIYLPASAYTGGNTQYSVAFDPYITTVQAGPVTTIYGGCYNSWVNQNAQYGSGNGGQWVITTLVPTTSWTANKTNVTNIGIEVNLSNSVATDFAVDNITIY